MFRALEKQGNSAKVEVLGRSVSERNMEPSRPEDIETYQLPFTYPNEVDKSEDVPNLRTNSSAADNRKECGSVKVVEVDVAFDVANGVTAMGVAGHDLSQLEFIIR